MVSVNLIGQFGNQLIQLAFAYYLSQTRRLNVYINNIHAYYKYEYISLLIEKMMKDNVLLETIENESQTSFYFYSLNEREIKDNVKYEGYFQSDKFYGTNGFFEKYVVCPQYIQDYINEKYGDILMKHTTVSIHVRRGDYLNYGNQNLFVNLCDNTNYYQKTISQFDNSPNVLFLVFSNDIEYCEKFFGTYEFSNYEFMFICEDMLIDFFLMSKCSHNIIANSTFSYCASYINNDSNSMRYAPMSWFVNPIDNKKYINDLFIINDKKFNLM